MMVLLITWPVLTAASKHATPGRKSVQGRELVMQLSNALLQRMSPEQIASKLASSFEETYGRPCTVAIHLNKTMTNLHAHLIYSERDLLQEPVEKIAPRALFFDEEGKRHYKKAEILDEEGQLRPGCRIVAKGEIYERRYFGAVDQTFSHKGWLKKAKSEWLLPLRNGDLKGDVEITEYDPSTGKLPQQHVGNYQNSKKETVRETARQVAAYNRTVRVYNQMVDAGEVLPDPAQVLLERMRRSRQRNTQLQKFVIGLRRIQYKWEVEQQERRRIEAEKARLRQQMNGRKMSLSDQMKGATLNTRINWRLQEQLDLAMGTDYAKQDKARYFQQKKEREGR